MKPAAADVTASPSAHRAVVPTDVPASAPVAGVAALSVVVAAVLDAP